MTAYSQKKRYTDNSEEYAEGGQFLPLSVWENKGFPIDRIKQRTKPEDIQEDRVIGPTYRVSIISKNIKRKHGDLDENVAYFSADGGREPFSNLRGSGASTSSDRPESSVSIQTHITEEQARAKAAKALEKHKSNDLKKVSFNLNKFMSGLTKLKSEITYDKLPHFMKEDNALNKLIETGKQLQEQVAATSSDNAHVMKNKVDEFGTGSIAITKAFKAFM